jgi:NADH dehydrogenase
MSNDSSRAAVPHVLCLGGGYTGIYLARQLRSAVRAGRVRLTVVDVDNFQCFHGLIPDMITGKVQPTDTLSPSRRLFAPADFVNAEVETIDLAKRRVTVARLLDGRPLQMDYDHLVLALGSTEHLGRFPGLAEHSFRLRAYSGCLAVRNQFISMLELADMEPDPVERARLLTFVVVGGNFAGVEVAGELREFLPAVARRHFPRINVGEIKVVLVSSSQGILPELGTRTGGLSEYAERRLRADPHVELICDMRLASASSEEAILSDGRRIPTRTVISCTGMSIVPVLEQLPLARNAQQRVVTDRCARVPGQINVWAGGDCAAVPLADGSPAPALAIWAMTVGTLIGKNILRQLAGRELLPYRFTGLGDACVLGHRDAVGHVKGLQVRGLIAWLIWRVFMIIYLPSPEKKLRTVWNWLMLPFFGRDILNLRVSPPLNLAPVFFDAGQDIVREGEAGNSLFLIQEGEVEVLRRSTNGNERLAVLGPGQQFGEIAVFRGGRRTATVRAITRVRLVQMRRDAATLLAQSSRAMRDSLQSLPISRG